MSMAGLTLLVEGVVGALLVATIYFAVRLDRRLRTLRGEETGLRQLVTALSESSLRAERSVERLKAAGLDAERSLRGAIEKAQALRDELAFMIERGDALAGIAERQVSRARRKQGQPPPDATPETAGEDDEDIAQAVGYARAVAERPAAESQSERELMEALRAAQPES